MTKFFTKYLRNALLCIVTTVAVTGCASNGGDLSPAGTVATSVSAVSHYGSGIGIPEAYLDGGYIGSHGGWGGGGGSMCCVSMRSSGNQPTLVKMKWRTNRSNVGETRWHEETVPVHTSAKSPGSGYGLVVHFLPGHKVELWIADRGIGETDYPGPKYPNGPAPKYVPLPDEKPNPLE